MSFFYLQAAGRQSLFLLEEAAANIILVPITFGVTGCPSLVSLDTSYILWRKRKATLFL